MKRNNLRVSDPAKTCHYCSRSRFHSRDRNQLTLNPFLARFVSSRFSASELGISRASTTRESRVTCHESRPQLIANTPRIAPNPTLHSASVTLITSLSRTRHGYSACESRSVLGMLPKAIPGPAPISLHRRRVLGFALHGGDSPARLGGKATKSSQSSSLKCGGSK
jgi:hypothetical protein